MRCDWDMCRASELALKCVSSGYVAALGDGALVTPYINIEMESDTRASLLVDTGNSAGLVVTKAFGLLHFPHQRLERMASKLIDTAGASPLSVISEIESEASCSRGSAVACVSERGLSIFLFLIDHLLRGAIAP